MNANEDVLDLTPFFWLAVCVLVFLLLVAALALWDRWRGP